MASNNRVSVQEFEDIAVSLERNKSSSFMNDEAVKRSYGSKSKSFITAHDIGSDGPSPSSRKRVNRSVSSLGDSIMGISEAEEDEFSVSAEYLQLMSYECLLMCNSSILSESENRETAETTLNTLHSFRKGLSLSESAHDFAVSTLLLTITRVQGKVPVESILFRLYLIDTIVSQSLSQKEDTPEVRVSRSDDTDNQPTEQVFNDLKNVHQKQSQPELRHLAIFACAMNFAIKKACNGQPSLSDSQAQKLSQQLSHDTKKLRSRLVVFNRNPLPENAELIRTLIAGMVVRYTQYPFVGTSQATEESAAASTTEADPPPTPEAIDFTNNNISSSADHDDVVVTDGTHHILTVLNVSGEQDDDFDGQTSSAEPNSLTSITPLLRSLPIPTPTFTVSVTPRGASSGVSSRGSISGLLGYTYPLNIMIYATLFQTFFVEAEETDSNTSRSSSKSRRQHGVYRSRRQETRMKYVVDILTSFRSMFGISFFMHASCFIHVVFTEHLENSLAISDMFRLLSIDCYFYPGFKAYCQVTTAEPDEIMCRYQVLLNMKEELVVKLGDYHAQMSTSPEDLLFVAQMYAVILQYSSRQSESNKNDSDTEIDQINSAVQGVGKQLGDDIASQVREMLSSQSGLDDRAASGISIPAYCELTGLIVSSTVKHYIRVKYKVITSRREESSENSSGGRTLDLWLSQLNTSSSPTQERRAGYSSSMCNNYSAGPNQRLGASRLAPGQTQEDSNPAITLQQVNDRVRLSNDHVRYLLEVLLLELHADVKYYSSSLTCVLPNAVRVVLGIYCKLLNDDMSVSLESLKPPGIPSEVNQSSESIQPKTDPSVSSSGLHDSSEMSIKVDSPSRARMPPPPPKRSSSPPLPFQANGRAPRPTPADDIVSLSVLITNMIYTMLLLQLLRANVDQYLMYYANARDPPPGKKRLSSEKPLRGKSLTSLLRRNTRTSSVSTDQETDSLNYVVDLPGSLHTTITSNDDKDTSSSSTKDAKTRSEPLRLSPQNAPCSPGAMSPLSPGDSAQVSKASTDALHGIQVQLQKKWKSLVDTTLELYVMKVVSVDDFSPIGTSQEASISSSCVDLTLMANRIAVLVAHGIETSWDATVASKATINCSPAPSPDQLSNESLAQYFMTHCEGLIATLEDDSKAILNNAFRKYITTLVGPVGHVSWNVSETLDPRFIRSRFGWLFKDESHTLKRTALRANNITFIQRGLHDIYVRTISGYQQVIWKLVDNQNFQIPETTIVSPPIRSTTMKLSSPLSGSTTTGTSPYGLFDITSINLSETTVGLLLKFMATKVTCFDLYPCLQKLYTDSGVGINTLLDKLESILTVMIDFLSPDHRSLYLAFTLSAIAQITSARIVRGKMIKNDDSSRFDIFQELVEDLHAIREFFMNRDSDGNPTFLQEKEVESLTACVLSTLLVLLSRNPGILIREQAAPQDGLPINILYTKDQVQGMMVQIAGRSYLAHNLLLEALEVQREMELQESWDEQRSQLMMLTCNQQCDANDGDCPETRQVDSNEPKGEKKVVSRTCLVM